MIRGIDRAWKICPMVTPTVFVDDLSAEMAAPGIMIVENLGLFITVVVAKGFKDGEMELSLTQRMLSVHHGAGHNAMRQLGEGGGAHSDPGSNEHEVPGDGARHWQKE